jgi:hypothetical protein
MVACAVRWCYKLLQVGKGKASLWCVYLAAQKLCGWRMALCRRSRVGVFVVCDKLRMRCCPRVTLRSFTWRVVLPCCSQAGQRRPCCEAVVEKDRGS